MFGFMTRAAMACVLSAATVAALALALASPATAQTTWTGPYIGVHAGAGLQRDDAAETVTFDTNLDGTFTDIVRTAAGADAFSPGFCSGIAMGTVPASGCTEDENGFDIGGRVGYDWSAGMFVVGALVDVSGTDVTDGVSSFSTTPAFYAFSRQLKAMGGVRGRAGVGNDRLLVYGTGGPAWGRIEHIFTTSNAVNTFVPGRDAVRTENAWGYQAGGGLEVRVASRWTLSGEYLYARFDDDEDGTVRSQGPAPATNPFILVNPAGTDLRRSQRFDVHSVRVALNYRF
jgi:outer membrane immunogenic protein